MQNVVEISNVTVWRGETRVLQDFSLVVPRHCNTAILGPNGAGKSTLLKLLSRDLLPVHEEGSGVQIFGRERWNVWELRARMGIVSHDLQIEYPGHYTGGDVVLSGHRSSLGVWEHQGYTHADRARAGEVLTRLGVSELAGKPFARMSTGEQRRFLLARALVHDPELLILDEPTSGLDLEACFHYVEVVRELMREGRTVLLVTHHIHEIPPEIERVVLLRRGEVVADGAKADVLTDAHLSRAFGTEVELLEANGFYQAVPGKGSHPNATRHDGEDELDRGGC